MHALNLAAISAAKRATIDRDNIDLDTQTIDEQLARAVICGANHHVRFADEASKQ